MPRLRTIAAMSCLLACAGVSILWARRAAWADVLAFCTPGGHWQVVASTRAGVVFFVSAIPAGPEWGGTVRAVTTPSGDLEEAYFEVFDPTALRRSAAGFKLARGTFTIGAQTPGYQALQVPHWAIAVALAVPPLLWARGRLRRRRWTKQGRCRHCGYDLRGSPDRCPECGAVPPGGGPPGEMPEFEGLPAKSNRRFAIMVLIVVVAGGAGLALLPAAWRSTRGPLRQESGALVRLYEAADLAPAFYDTPRDPAVRRYETPADDPESPENQAELNVCFGPPAYTGVYPRVVDERPERLQDFGDSVLFATDAARDGDNVVGLPSSGRLIVVARPVAQAQFAQLLEFLRDPAASGLSLIVAGGIATPSSPGIQDAERKLAAVLPEVRFDGIPLESAFEQVGEAAKANLVVDWTALEAAGVERDRPVKLHLWDLPVSRVLAVLLATVADEDRGRLGFRAEEGVIRITTEAALAQSGVVTRAYDVRLLVEQILRDARRATAAETGATTRPDAEDEWMTWAEAVEQISTIIKEDVDPDSWRDNGGNVGAVRELGGRLFVRHTPEGHRAVEAALKLLSDAMAED